MVGDPVIGAEQPGNDLDPDRLRQLHIRQVHLPVNLPGGPLTETALSLPVFPGLALNAAPGESQGVCLRAQGR